MECRVTPDLTLPANLTNPNRHYGYLRECDPVHWNPSIGGWMLTRYDDVQAAENDPRRFSSVRIEKLLKSHVPQALWPRLEPFIRLTSFWMFASDAPQHRPRKALLSKAFTPKSIADLEPFILLMTDRLLTTFAGRERVDLVQELFSLIPNHVLAALYGLPHSDAPLLQHWSDNIAIFLTGCLDDSHCIEDSIESIEQMNRYFLDAIDRRRSEPQDDLITRVVAEADLQGMQDEEICGQLTLVITAGYSTTAFLLGTGLFNLLKHPQQMQALRAEPSLMKSAINEMLRYESPSQVSHRVLTENMTLHSKALRKGDLVYLVRAAANRDPLYFADPDCFDIRRAKNPHTSFGGGVHFCIGTALARMEVQCVLSRLLERFSKIELIESDLPQWRLNNFQFRSMATFPVRLSV